MLTLKFTSTGQGHVLCTRTHEDGSSRGSFQYGRGQKPHPLGLSPSQQDEFDAAHYEEFGE